MIHLKKHHEAREEMIVITPNPFVTFARFVVYWYGIPSWRHRPVDIRWWYWFDGNGSRLYDPIFFVFFAWAKPAGFSGSFI